MRQRSGEGMDRHNSLTSNEKKAIGELKAQLMSRLDVLDAKLFGSKARGDATEGSDVDIMIEIAEATPETQTEIFDLVFRINLENDTFISVVTFDRAELEEGPMSESPLYKRVQQEGISI
jgi:predicted nucleotidyltransferase